MGLYAKSAKPDTASNPFLAALFKANAEEVIEVWPENWQAVQVFCLLSTQWQAGFAGVVGLRYESLYPLLSRVTSSDDEWDQLFADVQVLEREALTAMNEKD